MSTRDVVMVSDLFGPETDLIYDKLDKELENSDVKFQPWENWKDGGETIHYMADHKKYSCPTFNMVLNKIRVYFDMRITDTRLNWYGDSSHWKPFHHDKSRKRFYTQDIESINYSIFVNHILLLQYLIIHCKKLGTFPNTETESNFYIEKRPLNFFYCF